MTSSRRKGSTKSSTASKAAKRQPPPPASVPVPPKPKFWQEHLEGWWQSYKAGIAKREAFKLDRLYLPAVIELQETPPSPTARYLLYSILTFIVLALFWSMLGRVDVIAVGQGKIVPTGRVKVIQPLESGVVKAIHVQDGQRVKAGDLLVELDLTMTQADTDHVQNDLMLTEADMARLNALLSGTKPEFSDQLPPEALSTEQNLYLQAKEQHEAEIQNLRQQFEQKTNELEGTKAQVQKLKETLPLVSERSASYHRLSQRGYASRSQASSIEEQRIQQAYDLKNQQAHARELQAEVKGAKDQISAAQASFQRLTLNELNDKTQKRAGLVQDLAKANQRKNQQSLIAPIDGYVQELKIHTVGGVVTPAQELMKVVPYEDALEAEVTVPNRDIGFVREGQPVRIKLEAFPFTKYGVIDGKVRKLSLDAVNDEKLGLIYIVRVSLDKSSLRVGNQTVYLTPGLAVTGEVKTSTRRIIEYFLSPLMEYSDEAIRER